MDPDNVIAFIKNQFVHIKLYNKVVTNVYEETEVIFFPDEFLNIFMICVISF